MQLYALPVGEIGTNCYLAASKQGNAAIVDPGAEPERILALLRAHNLTPRLILLTHGHFDHIGAAGDLRRELSIPLLLHSADAELLADPVKNGGQGLMGRTVTSAYDRLLEDEEKIALDELLFRVIHTPGHTRGSVCFDCGGLLLTGDTLFCQGVGRTDLYGGSAAALQRSLLRLSALEGDRKILPGHGPSSTLDAERTQNLYLRAMR